MAVVAFVGLCGAVAVQAADEAASPLPAAPVVSAPSGVTGSVSSPTNVKEDRQALRVDRKKLHQDREKMQADVKQFGKDSAEVRQDRLQLKQDRIAFRSARHQLKQDKSSESVSPSTPQAN